jgi:hypothetical protein
MALITENHPALSGDPKQFWRDELNNSKILLYELDKAILALSKKEIAHYTINTGQDSMTITRHDLPNLYARQATLLIQIQNLENIINPKSKLIQVVPGW